MFSSSITPTKIVNLAPKGATVLLQHQDGRMFFAEKFEIGFKFWNRYGSNERILQGIIHRLKLLATLNEEDGLWYYTESSSETPTDGDFISLRSFEYRSHKRPDEITIAIARNGKICLGANLRDSIGIGNPFGMAVTANFQRIMIRPGDTDYIMTNPSEFFNRCFSTKIMEHFLPGETRKKIKLVWDESLKGFVGNIY